MVSSLDIINRALQKLGKNRIGATGDLSLLAAETTFSYDFLRRAELRRNVWRFSIRKVALRALDLYMQRVTPAAWAIGTSYAQNDIVTASNGQIYISVIAANSGNDPVSTSGSWALYAGPLIATPFPSTWSAVPAYAVNDVVLGSDSNYYISIAASNTNHDPTGDGGVHWTLLSTTAATGILPAFTDHGLTFFSGELVFAAGAVYLSLVSNNTTDPTTDATGSWLTLTARPSLARVNFIYPIGSGPTHDATTRNVFILPNGFMSQAPQDPKAGVYSRIGAPSGHILKDWNFENSCFTSQESGVVIFRFAADISDASQFDAMFVEGLACRIALEMCEILTGSTAKLEAISAEYSRFMGEARIKNGIETGITEPPVDDFIICRY